MWSVLERYCNLLYLTLFPLHIADAERWCREDTLCAGEVLQCTVSDTFSIV